jgi:hypothetical protein
MPSLFSTVHQPIPMPLNLRGNYLSRVTIPQIETPEHHPVGGFIIEPPDAACRRSESSVPCFVGDA